MQVEEFVDSNTKIQLQEIRPIKALVPTAWYFWQAEGTRMLQARGPGMEARKYKVGSS